MNAIVQGFLGPSLVTQGYTEGSPPVPFYLLFDPGAGTLLAIADDPGAAEVCPDAGSLIVV